MSHARCLALLLFMCCVACDGVDQQFKAAISSGNHGKILRAFHEATYNRRSSLEPSRSALKECLKNNDPVIRLYAAEYLYTIGDNTGYDTLITLIKMSGAVDCLGKDVRLRAVNLLKRYREQRAIPEIHRFFLETKAIDAFYALLYLGRDQSLVNPLTAYPDAHPYRSTTVFSLSIYNSKAAEKLAASTFLDPKCPNVYAEESTQIAAWAMLRAGQDEPYFSHLYDQAIKAVAGTRPPGSDCNQYRKALKYISSISDPRVVALLERGLESSDHQVVQVSIVNLIFNQHTLESARKRLIAEINNRTLDLGSEFTFQLAAVLNNTEITKAAERFSEMDSSNEWRLWSIIRKGWPIYNWIDDYVVILNEPSK